MKKTILIIIGALCYVLSLNAQSISLNEIAQGFKKPVDIAHAGDQRMFIVEKDGLIKIIDNGDVLAVPFLDIDDKVNSSANERGLLGLAFHPNYETNGIFFIHYNNQNGTTTISRFTVSAADINLADKNSESIILTIAQPFSNHNGGDLNFGPDGYLYIGMGDGGSGGDPGNRSQNRQELLGKMLRIDIDNGTPYGIPPDNPFANDDETLDEIWAIGLRNPWRFSFDRITGDMYIGDVGQDVWEEVNFEPAGIDGGLNYGWRCYEANAPYNLSNCDDIATMTFPVHEYLNIPSGEGCSITGGYVYRGAKFGSLEGKYIYADFCSGKIWSLHRNECGHWKNTELHDGASQDYSSFGENVDGDLFVAGLGSGKIFEITSTCSIGTDPQITEASCEFNDGAIDLNISGGSEPMMVNWSNGMEGASINGLAVGEYEFTIEDDQSCILTGCISLSASDIPEPCAYIVDVANICDMETLSISNNCAWPDGYHLVIYLNGELYEEVFSPDDIILYDQAGVYTTNWVNGPCSSDISNTLTLNILAQGDAPEIYWNVVLDSAFIVSDTFVSYVWNIDGMDLSGQNGPFIPLGGSTGPITVFGIDANGCPSLIGGPYFIENITSVDKLILFQCTPNPFEHILSISVAFESVQNGSITLLDTHGKYIKRIEFKDQITLEHILDVQNLVAGIYLIQLEANGKKVIQRIVKK